MGKFESIAVEAQRQFSVVKAPLQLSEIELESHISVPRAAAIKGISPDTFRRHFAHLIHKPSPRRNTVKLRDVLGR
jgi:hypothetical protein